MADLLAVENAFKTQGMHAIQGLDTMRLALYPELRVCSIGTATNLSIMQSELSYTLPTMGYATRAEPLIAGEVDLNFLKSAKRGLSLV